MTLIELTPPAIYDLNSIADYIAQDSPRRAATFIAELKQTFLRIGRDPLTYPMRPEIGDGLRVGFHQRYVICFRIRGEVIRIERILHGGRDLPSQFQSIQ
jgi:toxin ParE1/3/4